MVSGVEVTICDSDADLEAWRTVRLAVVPEERTATVAELRAMMSGDRRFFLARQDGEVVGSGMADRSDVDGDIDGGAGAVIPRVLPEKRRRGVGTALLEAMAAHCSDLGLARVRASAEDAGQLAFARRFGFHEIDREVEQLRTIGDEPHPGAPPDGLDVVEAADRPGLWAACFDTFGREVLSDFAVSGQLEVSPEEWVSEWGGEPLFLALDGDRVVGCAGLLLDEDHPERAENALTATSRDWRRRGVAEHLKLTTLHWAATHGLREVYTWTQDGNAAMRRLNERLGYRPGRVGITLSADLPLHLRT